MKTIAVNNKELKEIPFPDLESREEEVRKAMDNDLSPSSVEGVEVIKKLYKDFNDTLEIYKKLEKPNTQIIGIIGEEYVNITDHINLGGKAKEIEELIVVLEIMLLTKGIDITSDIKQL